MATAQTAPRPGAPAIPVKVPEREAAVGSGEDDQSPAWRIGKRVLGYTVLVVFALAYLLPFVLAIATSFKTRPDAASNPVSFLPNPAVFRAWRDLADTDFPRWAMNSIFISVSVTLGRIFLDSLAGYALARLKWPGRGLVFGLIVGVLAVPGIVLAIPRFLVLGELNMLNSYYGLIIPLAVDAFGIFLMKQFFEGIPKEMEEAARIDGAGVFQTYWYIVLPLAAPGLISLTILSFQGSWNEFLHPLIVAGSSPDLRPLPVGMALLRGQFGENLDFPVLIGGSILMTIPVAIVFFTFQRFFVRGATAGGVKG